MRLVVDPSMTGLNTILAKGENLLNSSNKILLQSRLSKYIWSTDVSKLYNRLYLDTDHYNYSLFLYSHALDRSINPEVRILSRAWYGVVSSGNQAAVAISQLANQFDNEYPIASSIISESTYVDDILHGCNSIEERDEQINQTTELLAQGGFPLKFIVKSHEPLPPDASVSDEEIKLLGYKYIPESDLWGIAFGEFNVNRKIRGEKKPNPFIVNDVESCKKLLGSIDITRRIILSKAAEIYDPLGLIEPFKVQLKLKLNAIKDLPWDQPITGDSRDEWIDTLSMIPLVSLILIPRSTVPPSVTTPFSVRLLVLCDAAASCVGAAVYASYELPNNKYSCQLLT